MIGSGSRTRLTKIAQPLRDCLRAERRGRSTFPTQQSGTNGRAAAPAIRRLEYPLRLQPQLLCPIEGRQGVPIDAGVQRGGIGVAPKSLDTVLLVRRGCAGFEKDIVDDLGRGPRGKTVIAADAHALFDVERAAGAHDVLAFPQTGQHQGLRSIDACGGLADQALNQRRIRQPSRKRRAGPFVERCERSQ